MCFLFVLPLFVGDENEEKIACDLALAQTVRWTVCRRRAHRRRVPEDGPKKYKKLQTPCLEFFYSYPIGDENQEPTVYPSSAFCKKQHKTEERHRRRFLRCRSFFIRLFYDFKPADGRQVRVRLFAFSERRSVHLCAGFGGKGYRRKFFAFIESISPDSLYGQFKAFYL